MRGESVWVQVEYVVSQPIELNIEELVIRPQKRMF